MRWRLPSTRAAGEYISEYMATSVHIPPALLAAADRKAAALGISRNRLIVRALERELLPGGGWSPGFFDAIASIDADTADAARAMDAAIKAGRRSKRAVRL
jgi:hypothetical protein